jgi:hypothetical protein
MSRAESRSPRLLLEFRSRKRFANYVLFGQVRRETWRAFFKKPLRSQQAQRILSPLRLPVPPRPHCLSIALKMNRAGAPLQSLASHIHRKIATRTSAILPDGSDT